MQINIEVGKKYGELTVVNLHHKHGNRGAAWLCLCSCGKSVVRNSHKLVDPAVKNKSCGCKWKGKPKDLSGRLFSYLLGIRPANENDVDDFGQKITVKKGQTKHWLFKCTGCGKNKILQVNEVTTGNTKSCGCRYKEMSAKRRITDEAKLLTAAYCSHKLAAKKRGIQNFLTKEDYYLISKKRCHYCGGMTTRKNNTPGRPIELPMNTIDRLNGERYYKLENSVPACKTCNIAKMAMTEKQFIDWVLRIHRHQTGSE